MTTASSSSLRAKSIMPVYTAARPPGTIQAFTIFGSSTTVHVHAIWLPMRG